jgi:hypothetical protein
MQTKQMQIRRSTGSMVVFGVVLALILIIVGVSFFGISMWIGGQNETKNAVDAGMLNVGKQVLDDISVPLQTPNEFMYIDVCNDATDGKSLLELLDSDIKKKGQVTLRRINRVWAKALQIGINAEAAEREGHGGEGKSNAQQAFDGAKSISDRLADKITDKTKLYSYFDDLAKRNSVRMLGTKAHVTSVRGNNWQTALMDRDRESNITAAPPEYTLPPNFEMPDLVMKSSRKQISAQGKDLWFLRGYTPIKLADRTFWQVPFPYDQAPHLVSGREFNTMTEKATPIGDWPKPIPNAFSGEGVAAGMAAKNATQKATSWVLTNPGQPFKMSLPHSFVRIKIDDMLCHWYFYPLGPEADKVESGDPTKYDFKEPKFESGPKMSLGGPFCAWVQAGESVQLGLEVFARSLDEVIFGAPGEGNVTIEAYLLNRTNEMIGKVGKVITKEELHKALDNWTTRGFLFAGQTEFYVFSADGETLEVLPKYLALAKAPWLILYQGNDPDGTEMKIVDDADTLATIINNVSAKPFPKCILVPPKPFGWGLWDKDIYWTPGSGYNSCLGNLRVKRWTEVYSVGIAVPNPV